MRVDLNVDLGELPDESGELYALATVVNVACGGHAGDPSSMRRALGLAKTHRARVAAHPSYADREGFGRRPGFSPLAPTALAVASQLDALVAAALEAGVALVGLKLHGALYHDAARDPALARALIDVAVERLPALETVAGPPHGPFADAAHLRGLGYQREGFADRRYAGEALVPRTQPGALLESPEACVAQALAFARLGRFDTLCVHGDTPGSVEIARAVRDALASEDLLAERA